MEACHSPHQFIFATFDATAVAIITIELFTGMWINAFIISVLCMSWVKKKTLNSNEKILLVLGCSRFCYLCVSWVYFFLSVIYPTYISIRPRLTLLLSLQNFLNDSSLWFSASLCVFYCVKIANFRSSFFIYLKVKMDRIVPWLLLRSVLFSLLIGILVYDALDKSLCKNLNFTSQGNNLKPSLRREEHFTTVFIIVGFVFVTSFTAIIVSALLLLFSLWRHKRNMQTNSMKDLSMDAHIRAMKSVLSFFIMYSINFIFLILTLIHSFASTNHVMFLIYVFLYAFPVVHSLILIFSNPQLAKTMLRILPFVKCKVCMK